MNAKLQKTKGLGGVGLNCGLERLSSDSQRWPLSRFLGLYDALAQFSG